jgi:hypothetical protein
MLGWFKRAAIAIRATITVAARRKNVPALVNER